MAAKTGFYTSQPAALRDKGKKSALIEALATFKGSASTFHRRLSTAQRLANMAQV